jgi:hypothetical protein
MEAEDLISINSGDVDWEISCDQCPLDNVSEYTQVCKQCLIQLCALHASTHGNSRFTEKHTLIDRKEAESSGVNQDLDSRRFILRFAKPCKDHSLHLTEMYCVDCQLFVCNLCAFSDNHQNHEFKIAKEYASTLKRQLELINFSDFANNLAQRLKRIESRINLNRECRDQAIAILDCWYDTEQCLFDHKFGMDRDEVLNHYSKIQQTLLEQSTAASLLLQRLSYAQQGAQDAQNDADYFCIIQTSNECSRVQDMCSTIESLPDFDYSKLFLNATERCRIEYSLGLPFEMFFVWNEACKTYAIYLNPIINSAFEGYFGFDLYLTEFDAEGKTRSHECRYLEEETNNHFLLAQIPENHFTKLEVRIIENNVLVAMYDRSKATEANSQSWSEQSIIHELFRANFLPQPNFDETSKQYQSAYTNNWDYDDGKLCSM